MSDFQRPSNDFFAAKDYQGKLVLFENISPTYQKQTKFDKPGFPSTVLDADVTVIDADGGPVVYPRSVVFGMALVGTLSRALPGKPLLGRIGQGKAKEGQDPPWVLVDFTDSDAATASAYLRARAASEFSKPAAAPEPPRPDFVPPAQPAAPAAPAGVDQAAFEAAMAALRGGGLGPQPAEEPTY